MSASWQWFRETNTAVCCYCGFSTTYADEFPGRIEHDCDPTMHPSIATLQGLHIGRSPAPRNTLTHSARSTPRFSLRGAALRQEPCRTYSAGTRIKIFACEVHGECQLDDKIKGVKFCGECGEITAPTR